MAFSVLVARSGQPVRLLRADGAKRAARPPSSSILLAPRFQFGVRARAPICLNFSINPVVWASPNNPVDSEMRAQGSVRKPRSRAFAATIEAMHGGALIVRRSEHPMPSHSRHYRRPTNHPSSQRERAQYIEALAERHAQRFRLPLKSARRHIEQIAISARSTTAAKEES